MDNKTEKRLVPFKKIIFLDIRDKQCNIPDIPDKEKKMFYSDLKKKGFYNGCLNSVLNYNLEDNVLKIDSGKTDFFDLVLSKEINQNTSPALAVNAVIETDNHIVFITRGKEVYSYKGGIDFPAGLVPYNEPILDRLKDRIRSDTKLNGNELTIGEIIPCAIIENNAAFNLFYNVKYNGSKNKLEDFFYKNFNSKKPFLVKKSEVSTFFKEMNKPVFFEILNFI